NMVLQARAGADAVAMFDTCAGEIEASLYREKVVPVLRKTLEAYHSQCPEIPIVYYSKGTDETFWRELVDLPIRCLGVDWRVSLKNTLLEWGKFWSIQGNIDPQWLFLEERA